MGSVTLWTVFRRDIFARMKVSSLLYTQVRLPTKHILVLRNVSANLIQYVVCGEHYNTSIHDYDDFLFFNMAGRDSTRAAPNEGSARGPSALVE